MTPAEIVLKKAPLSPAERAAYASMTHRIEWGCSHAINASDPHQAGAMICRRCLKEALLPEMVHADDLYIPPPMMVSGKRTSRRGSSMGPHPDLFDERLTVNVGSDCEGAFEKHTILRIMRESNAQFRTKRSPTGGASIYLIGAGRPSPPEDRLVMRSYWEITGMSVNTSFCWAYKKEYDLATAARFVGPEKIEEIRQELERMRLDGKFTPRFVIPGVPGPVVAFDITPRTKKVRLEPNRWTVITTVYMGGTVTFVDGRGIRFRASALELAVLMSRAPDRYWGTKLPTRHAIQLRLEDWR